MCELKDGLGRCEPFDGNLVQLEDFLEFGNVTQRYKFRGVGLALYISLPEQAIDDIDLRLVSESVRQYHAFTNVPMANIAKMGSHALFKFVANHVGDIA